MMRSINVAAVSLGLALGTARCTDFLTGDNLSNNPNAPTNATRQQLLVAVQAAQFGWQESTIPMTVCMWMQQCTGAGGRFVEQFGKYVIDENSFTLDFSNLYIGGGLIDIRRIQQSARADGDSLFLAIAKIWEAFAIGSAADVWGDIPYSDAVGSSATPALDPQAEVYDSAQSLLNQALVELGGPGPGPGAADFVYGGDATMWRGAANTLKARFFMHIAEAVGAAAYDSAIKYATNGISAKINDLRTFHTQATSERNIWYQFQLTTFGQDIVAGKFLADLMNARSDPRRVEYFGTNSTGGYGGQDVNTPQPAATVSPLSGSGRNTATFRQPLVTWYENQLILAEARFQDAGGGAPGILAAQPHLDAVRADVGLTSVPATLQAIMEEKYVALFQNMEVWSDYRRTCLPGLTPYLQANGASPIWQNKIPGRYYYGSAERNVNSNIPDPSAQLVTGGLGFRNPNDTAACP